MKRICAALLLVIFLCGCAKTADKTVVAVGATLSQPEETETIAATVVEATIPPDGNADDITCKGSYTGEGSSAAVVAQAGERTLTNEQLAAWYWAAAAGYRQSGAQDAPDDSIPLDRQECTVDDSVASWQQYFLRQALNAWHTAAALKERSETVPIQTEEAYKPNLDNYEKYMKDMPATEYLYGYDRSYKPNSMHRSYLDSIPDTLSALAQQKGYGSTGEMAEEAFGTSGKVLGQMVYDMNYAYMYFTDMTYWLPEVEETVGDISDEYYVNFRHILLNRNGQSEEDTMEAFQKQAKARLQPLTPQKKREESSFADLAHLYSQDTASALDGGAYRRVRKGQLPEAIDAWCFAPERQPGDTTVISQGEEIHILYFSGKESVAQVEAAETAKRTRQAELICSAKDALPMTVTYEKIVLPDAEGQVSIDELLYPDVAHERYPEIPVYLQQDYPGVMFGGFELRTNGCGITTMAMLSTYMTDEYLSPPEMCRRYGGYSHSNGTDGMIFVKEPPVLGYYLIEKTYEPTVAWQGLEDGHVVISIQHKGYWTRGGHYIALEEITESGKVRVRDSNIFNYNNRVKSHAEDEHTWGSITGAGSGYWIFDDKITKLPGCARCGEPEKTSGGLVSDHYCRKCAPAQMRRGVYLESSFQ